MALTKDNGSRLVRSLSATDARICGARSWTAST
jgi:hypothetical protein